MRIGVYVTIGLIWAGSVQAQQFLLKTEGSDKKQGPFVCRDGSKVTLDGKTYVVEIVKPAGGSVSDIEKKMKKIVIPGIEFRQANLRNICDFLQQASRECDADHIGVNIVLNVASTEEFTFRAHNISLLDAVETLTKVAGLRYRIEGATVFIEPASTIMTKKLDSIIIPKIEFHQANIHDVIDCLIRAARENDPDKAGVSIVLMDIENKSEVTLDLQKLSLHETLKIIAEMAGLSVDVEDNAVWLRKPKEEKK